MTSPRLCAYYWRHRQVIGNLGDTLVPPILRALGYALLYPPDPRLPLLNPGRCLLSIGSLLTPENLRGLRPPLDVWGTGWKGSPLPPELYAGLQFWAVRGPLTAAGLGLPPDIPLGDPALLLPHLCLRSVARHGKTVVVTHFHRNRALPIAQRRRQSGCQKMLSTMVLQPQGFSNPGWSRQLLGLVRTWLKWGVQPHTVWFAVECIAGAGFVLTGSLHGAILAQAYGVPWAAYDDGYVDAPEKWHDWAAYLGIEINFAPTLDAGRRWWEQTGRYGRIRSLRPLLKAFPYPIQSPAAQQLVEELP